MPKRPSDIAPEIPELQEEKQRFPGPDDTEEVHDSEEFEDSDDDAEEDEEDVERE